MNYNHFHSLFFYFQRTKGTFLVAAGEHSIPLFVIVHRCKQSLLSICHIHGSNITIFFMISGEKEGKPRQEKKYLCKHAAEGMVV